MLGLPVAESLIIGILWGSLLVESLVVLHRNQSLVIRDWRGRPRRPGLAGVQGMNRSVAFLNPLPIGPVHVTSLVPGASCDLEETARVVAKVQRATVWLFMVTASYAVFLGVITPAAIVFLGPGVSWLPLVAIGTLYHVVTLTLFWRGHRQLQPEDCVQRWLDTFTMLLFPPAAVRAGERLTRPSLEDFHDLAVSWALGDEEATRRQAAAAFRQWRYPLPAERDRSSNPPACLLAVLAAVDLVPDTILKPPVQEEGSCLCYCPRCHGQYTVMSSECPDCPGVVVVEWPAEPAPHVTE